jgi:hypothetical protein
LTLSIALEQVILQCPDQRSHRAVRLLPDEGVQIAREIRCSLVALVAVPRECALDDAP